MVQSWRHDDGMRSYRITLTSTVQAATAADAERIAAELATRIGAAVSEIRDVTAPTPGERRCAQCGGVWDLPSADAAIAVCRNCLRSGSTRG
jgi:hypothetical protein